jgi:hypothetical protein
MPTGMLWDDFSPSAQVAIAVPFVIAIAGRLIYGRTRTASWMVTLSSVWLGFNMLMAPYSPGMRQSLLNLG